MEPDGADPRGRVTFATNNAKDVRRLYAQEGIHAGLIILIPNVPPSEQRVMRISVTGFR